MLRQWSHIWSQIVALAIMVVVCVSAFVIYAPGLAGPFLLDDTANLSKIGALGPIETWEVFRAYLASGAAGPTGRPLALTSFLIDARNWPADPVAFKRTNVAIHALIGLFLFAALQRLLQSIGKSPREASLIALLAATLWLLNPFLVSTTLYVVQRMTQLAALFVVLGFWGYLQGRHWLPTRPVLGYTTISLSVILATLLATLSKENGILLPLLILMTEFALRFHWKGPAPDWRWTAVFLWLPSVAVIGYLATRLPGLPEVIHARGWSAYDRLLTQPIILWDYLFHLFVPKIQTLGLYRDDLSVSRGLLDPPATLLALGGLASLVIGAIFARRRAPLLTLAVLFFLSAHLIESTVIPLELYFEHRNYIPALFLFVPVAFGLLVLRKRLSPAVPLLLAVALVGSFSVATWQRAVLWGDEELLHAVWSDNNPHSARAQITHYQLLAKKEGHLLALGHLRTAMRDNPESGILTAVYLANRIALGNLAADEFRAMARLFRTQSFDRQQPQALRLIVDSLNAQGSRPEHTAIMLELLQNWRSDWGDNIKGVREQAPFLQGLLVSGQSQGSLAAKYFTDALEHMSTVESGLKMASILASDEHFVEALILLDLSTEVLREQPDRSLVRKRSTYKSEITRLQRLIHEDLEHLESMAGATRNRIRATHPEGFRHERFE